MWLQLSINDLFAKWQSWEAFAGTAFQMDKYPFL